MLLNVVEAITLYDNKQQRSTSTKLHEILDSNQTSVKVAEDDPIW